MTLRNEREEVQTEPPFLMVEFWVELLAISIQTKSTRMNWRSRRGIMISSEVLWNRDENMIMKQKPRSPSFIT